MSFSVTLTTAEDGTAAVTAATGELPPGGITVSGHDDQRYMSISVTVNKAATP